MGRQDQDAPKPKKRARPPRYVGRKNQNALYKSMDKQYTNQRRRLRRHLASNPTDLAALKFFEEQHCKHDGKLCAKGRKVLKRIAAAEKAKAA